MTEDHILYPKTTMILLENAILSEVRGRIPELDEIVEDFQRAAKQRLEHWDHKSLIPLITTKDFSSVQDPFWKEINVEIVIESESVFQRRVNGEFGTNDTSITPDGKMNVVNIILSVWKSPKDSLDSIVDDLGATFAHEITHAYEQYSRLKTQIRKPKTVDLDDPEFTAAYDAGRVTNRDPHPVKVLKSIFYFVNNVEKKAFVAELYQKGKSIVKREGISDPEELYKRLVSSETQAGRSYQNCVAMMNKLWNNSEYWEDLDIAEFDRKKGESSYKDKVVQAWNNMTEKNVQDFKTVKDQVRRIWNFYRKTFKNKVIKVAYDAATTASN